MQWFPFQNQACFYCSSAWGATDHPVASSVHFQPCLSTDIILIILYSVDKKIFKIFTVLHGFIEIVWNVFFPLIMGHFISLNVTQIFVLFFCYVSCNIESSVSYVYWYNSSINEILRMSGDSGRISTVYRLFVMYELVVFHSSGPWTENNVFHILEVERKTANKLCQIKC